MYSVSVSRYCRPTPSEIDSALPEATAVSMLKLVEPPCDTDWMDGPSESPKSLATAASTVSCAVAVWPPGCEGLMPFTMKV